MKLLLIGFLLIVSGCVTKLEPRVEIKYVEIPVYINPPEPAKVYKPDLPIDYLDNTSTDDDVAKAYVSSIEMCKIYTKELEIALQPYKIKQD